MSLKKELGLNELIILCNITFYVITIFYGLNLLSDMIQRCLLYRDRKDGATTTASPRGPRSKITLYYQMMNSLKVTLHRIVTSLIFPKSLNLS